jgi:hypothetical protein
MILMAIVILLECLHVNGFMVISYLHSKQISLLQFENLIKMQYNAAEKCRNLTADFGHFWYDIDHRVKVLHTQ